MLFKLDSTSKKLKLVKRCLYDDHYHVHIICKLKLFIQLNIGSEKQKSGISVNNLKNFYNYCVNDLSLNVIGLMCLPPMDDDSDKYFKLLKKNSDDLNLKELSMGMSSDFDNAVINGSTFLRLGTIIMGERNIT